MTPLTRHWLSHNGILLTPQMAANLRDSDRQHCMSVYLAADVDARDAALRALVEHIRDLARSLPWTTLGTAENERLHRVADQLSVLLDGAREGTKEEQEHDEEHDDHAR